MWCVCVYLPLYLNMNIRWKREAITAFDRPQRNKWATNSDQFGHCRRPVQTNWGEREERRGFSDSWVKILARIRGWLWRSSGSSVFSCAQTIMANSSVHLFAMTRSCAALRAADLDWIVGLEYSLGGYIFGDSQLLRRRSLWAGQE